MFWKVIAAAGLLVMLIPGRALAVQYPPSSSTTTTTTRPVGPTVTRVKVTSPPKVTGVAQKRAKGTLAKTGADNVAMAVRVGVVLVVAGFVFYLVGRNRRAVRK